MGGTGGVGGVRFNNVNSGSYSTCKLAVKSKTFLLPSSRRHPSKYLAAPILLLSLSLSLSLLIVIALALLEARARDEPHDVPQKQVLVLATKHSLESKVGWSGVKCWLVG